MKCRIVYTVFWRDPEVVEEMSVDDRYFFVYLLTHPDSTSIGISIIARKQMALDLECSVEMANFA